MHSENFQDDQQARNSGKIAVSTHLEYLELAKRLRSAYSREIPGAINPARYIEWVQKRATDRSWSNSTVRKTRAAITYEAKLAIQQANESKRPDVQRAYEKLINLVSRLNADGETIIKRGPAKKLKALPLKQYNQTQEALAESNSKYAEFISLFLACSEVCGFRPSEWPSAKVVVHKPSGTSGVRVLNGKNSQGRANGNYRIVWLPEKSAEVVLPTIKAFITALDCLSRNDHGEVDGNLINKAFDNAARQLRRIQKRLGYKKCISFYSARHQFTANHKFMKKSLTDMAALLGHRSIETATEHYGKKATGRTPIEIIPDEDNLKFVRAYSEFMNISEADVLFKSETSLTLNKRN